MDAVGDGVAAAEQWDVVAGDRDEAAWRRDCAGAARDVAAGERDRDARERMRVAVGLVESARRVAAVAEVPEGRVCGVCGSPALGLVGHLDVALREAEADREAAAGDRRAAAADRRMAAEDRSAEAGRREQAAVERAQAVGPAGAGGGGDVGGGGGGGEALRVRGLSLRARAGDACRAAREFMEEGVSGRELLRVSELARLRARLASMPVIEQAKGIIMGQNGCGEAEAFDVLRRASQRMNVPVRDLAAQIVANTGSKGAGRAGSPAPSSR